jgi:lactoylglutathione lyase
MKFGMNHIHIKAEDPKQTAQWYVDNLGAVVAGEAEVNGSLTVRTDLGGVRVNITQASPDILPAGTSDPHMGLEHFGIETDDLDGAISTFESKGVKVLEEIRSLPNGMRIAFIEAPDNVRLELMQLP